MVNLRIFALAAFTIFIISGKGNSKIAESFIIGKVTTSFKKHGGPLFIYFLQKSKLRVKEIILLIHVVLAKSRISIQSIYCRY